MSGLSCCGVRCDECEYYDSGDPEKKLSGLEMYGVFEKCPGCAKLSGKPFWTKFVNAPFCPIYHCCVTEKNLEHCGHCEKLPCEKFGMYENPTISKEEQKLGLEKAVKNLKNEIK